MRQSVLAAIAASTLTMSAASFAGTMGDAQTYNWAGFYVGGQIGYNNTNVDWFYDNSTFLERFDQTLNQGSWGVQGGTNFNGVTSY